MYTQFYKLKEKPFRISSDPSFMWLGEKHREALSTLKYAIFDSKGFMLLTGDVGTGKTTLINALTKNLSDNVYCASVPDPKLSVGDFFNYIAQAYQIDHEFESKGAFLFQFGWFLEAAYKQKKKVLLIIDEAQLLSQDLLEEIRLLSNINRDGNHLLNIILVGQNEFNDILRKHENRALAQRLTLCYNLEHLSLSETENYIKYRLRIVGGTRMLFTKEAVREIHGYAEGTPRRINVICDHALLTGFVEGKQLIDAEIIRECFKEVEIPRASPAVSEQEEQPAAEPWPVALAGGREDSRKKAGRRLNLKVPLLTGAAMIATILFVYLIVPDQFIARYDAAAITQDRSAEQRSPLPAEPAAALMTASEASEVQAVAEAYAAAETEAQAAEFPEDAIAEAVPAGEEPGSRDPGPEVGMVSAGTTVDTGDAAEKTDLSGEEGGVSAAAVAESTGPTLPEPPQLSPLPERKVIVNFESDSNDFTVPDLQALNVFVEGVRAHPEAVVKITGYSDTRGDESYNTRLSLFRANIVKGYLLGRGVPPDQLEVEGRGSRNPIGDNHTREGRQLNRRVEIAVKRANEG